jgi:glycerophosphoryl diester phosphodiesterase
LPIPPDAWHTTGLDFIEGLPKSNKFDTILVIVDKFSKYGHFIPLKHPFTAQTVAQAFLENVYCRHGLPQVLISNRDKIFISSFWQNLFKNWQMPH